MYALRVGLVLLVVIAVLAWLLSARVFPRIGGWVSSLFKPFKQTKEKETETSEQPKGTTDSY